MSTPGPWTLYDKVNVIGPGRRVVANAGAHQGTVPSEDIVRETNEANARLIAAAPDLLEAIKPLMRPGCGDPDCACGPSSKALARAVAAVAKAEGK